MNKKLFWIFIPLFLCLWGCSGKLEGLQSVQVYRIYVYPTVDVDSGDVYAESAVPQQRLAVLVKSTSDTRYVSHIEVYHPQSKLNWKITAPVVAGNDADSVVGSYSLKPPYFSDFPTGTYLINYTDFAGNTVSKNFTLTEHSDVFPPVYGSVFDYFKTGSPDFSYNLVVFEGKTGQGKILYYGKPQKEWTTLTSVQKAYPEALSVRISAYSKLDSSYYLLPPTSLDGGNDYE